MFSAPGLHTRTHSAQNVHSPDAKSTWGNPPSPGLRIAVGQPSMQAPQRSQTSSKDSVPCAHGGRIALPAELNRPLRKLRRVAIVSMVGQLPCLPYGFELNTHVAPSTLTTVKLRIARICAAQRRRHNEQRRRESHRRREDSRRIPGMLWARGQRCRKPAPLRGCENFRTIARAHLGVPGKARGTMKRGT